MTVTETLTSFLEDENAWEMYITGPAGTGKTTSLKEAVQYCIDNGISYVVCAFTHKACGVLQEKLPKNADVQTLHSYLRKRPGINDQALHSNHVDIRMKMADSERPQIVFIDEYGMVGEQDYVDLIAMQDPHDEEQSEFIKTVYIGDPYQLLPVGDMLTIRPKAPYWVRLTKVYRTDHQDLMDAMTQCINMLDGYDLEPLTSSEHLIRGQDIVKSYKDSTSANKACLAWTNQAVQDLNEAIAEKSQPDNGDGLWCPTLRHELLLEQKLNTTQVNQIITPKGDFLIFGTKYKTLEYLLDWAQIDESIQFYQVFDETLSFQVEIAVCFGHYNYKQKLKELTDIAVQSNNRIKQEFNIEEPAQWARQNYGHPAARERGNAWWRLLVFKEAVCCVDFPYAMTIHKSQGSTYEEVYLDSQDLSQCGASDVDMYIRLFYVALSRASNKVVTN